MISIYTPIDGTSLKTHIEPELACFLNEHPQHENALLFTLKNEGFIDATTVSVDHFTMRYFKSERRIRIIAADGGPIILRNEAGVRWIFRSDLRPNEAVAKLAGEFAASLWDETQRDIMDVLLFDISYLRETDGRKFEKRCTYYVDRGTVYNYESFRGHEHFEGVNAEIARHLDQGIDLQSPDTRNRE